MTPPAGNWLGLSDQWIVGIATGVTAAVGALWRYYAKRSEDRAAQLNTAMQRREETSVAAQDSAFKTLNGIIETLRLELKEVRAQVDLTKQDHNERIARLERRNGRMNAFIVRLLDAYLQIKAYVSVLESVVIVAQPTWPRREFEAISLPDFDVDPPPAAPPVR